MKKIICRQSRVLDENELKNVSGGVNWNGIQTALSSDKGCQVGARESIGSRKGKACYGGCNTRCAGSSHAQNQQQNKH